MIRLFGGLIGLGLIGVLLIAFISNLSAYISEPPAETAEHAFHEEPKDVSFSSDGPFGTWDQAQLQRGFQVYKEVCAACHGLQYVAFRNLEELGYSEDATKALAATWPIEVPTINPETGERTTRPAIPSDRFPSPYDNEVAARAANNNAYPPDLSLITKAREGGAPYIYSLLTGYQDPSAELLSEFPEAAPGAGLYHNPYFANLNIAMPPPIQSDGQVSYGEGAPAPTVDQMAKDVSAFLIWTAEPKLVQRKQTGWAVLVFLAFATGLAYMAYRNVWAEAKRKVAPKGPLDPEHMAEREEAKAEAAEHGRGVEG